MLSYAGSTNMAAVRPEICIYQGQDIYNEDSDGYFKGFEYRLWNDDKTYVPWWRRIPEVEIWRLLSRQYAYDRVQDR